VVTDGVNAVLVAPGDVEALAAALRRVLGDQELSERLIAGGMARADTFSMAALADCYVAIYRELLVK
jgi:glycosyltransferase involved in cell wall biosynthesis